MVAVLGECSAVFGLIVASFCDTLEADFLLESKGISAAELQERNSGFILLPAGVLFWSVKLSEVSEIPKGLNGIGDCPTFV